MKKENKQDRPTINDYEWDDKLKIPATVHIGLRWKDKDGHQCRSHVGEYEYHKKTAKRIARLAEHSLVDTMEIGAMHYYASIQVRSADVFSEKEKTVYSCGGYGPEKPDAYLDSIRIEARRKLLKPEKDMSGERICRVGELTHRFNSAVDAKAAALAIFKRKFGPGWALITEDMGESDEYPILAET